MAQPPTIEITLAEESIKNSEGWWTT